MDSQGAAEKPRVQRGARHRAPGSFRVRIRPLQTLSGGDLSDRAETSAALLLPVLLALSCAHHQPTPPLPMIEHTVRPEVADPQADKWLQDQLAYLDPSAPRANKLVVYL